LAYIWIAPRFSLAIAFFRGKSAVLEILAILETRETPLPHLRSFVYDAAVCVVQTLFAHNPSEKVLKVALYARARAHIEYIQPYSGSAVCAHVYGTPAVLH
jgi:hypothetical protein